MGIQYKTDLARVERFIGEAKAAAWGPKMIPIEGRRKVRVALGGQARVDEDGNVLAGRSIDMMVDGNGSVFIVRV
jgi:DnaJ homolog subfamily C member 1